MRNENGNENGNVNGNENGNEKWELRNEKCKCSISLKIRHIELWINKKRLFNELPN